MKTAKRSGSIEKNTSASTSPVLPSAPDSGVKPLLSSAGSSHFQPAQYALKFIKATKHGYRPDKQWIKLRLGPGDYSWLEDQIKADDDLWGYVLHKLRFDYDPHSRELIFRMPSAIHEIFIANVVSEILFQLNRLGIDTSKPEIAALARSILPCASTDIVFYSNPTDKQEYPKKSPDASFGHENAAYPSLIIEVSYSQKRKDLPRLADNYIIGSHGNVRMVIGLDIEYRHSKGATVSVWQPDEGFEMDGTPYLGARQVVECDPFRNGDSSPLSTDAALTIPVSIFEPPTSTTHSQLPAILIPYTTLYTILNKAEIRQQVMGNTPQRGFERKLVPGTRLKMRPLTPEEQLNDSDEARYAMMEEDAIKKTDEADGTWGEKTTRKAKRRE
ncbi:MAG: hypothetical protein M1839_001674 [Geoglossum umbratile]|nr:MAG: hypothetical protein M1839_001674 [Geoglossum umbratile]